jgi:hypothetical protein
LPGGRQLLGDRRQRRRNAFENSEENRTLPGFGDDQAVIEVRSDRRPALHDL